MQIKKKLQIKKVTIGGKKMKLTAWEKVEAARKLNRPKALDYIKEMFQDFIELHGDRKKFWYAKSRRI